MARCDHRIFTICGWDESNDADNGDPRNISHLIFFRGCYWWTWGVLSADGWRTTSSYARIDFIWETRCSPTWASKLRMMFSLESSNETRCLSRSSCLPLLLRNLAVRQQRFNGVQDFQGNVVVIFSKAAVEWGDSLICSSCGLGIVVPWWSKSAHTFSANFENTVSRGFGWRCWNP